MSAVPLARRQGGDGDTAMSGTKRARSHPPERLVRATLRRGGLICYPTESCFGLGCLPDDMRAVRRLLALKRRSWKKGLILISDSEARFARFVSPLSPAQCQTVRAVWPGPHTWIVPCRARTPHRLSGEGRGLAIRVTAEPIAANLARIAGAPLVSTSANRSGRRAIKTYREAARQFGRSALIIRGRVGKRSRPSTVQHLASGRILRP